MRVEGDVVKIGIEAPSSVAGAPPGSLREIQRNNQQALIAAKHLSSQAGQSAGTKTGQR